jgi:hypothetical protein
MIKINNHNTTIKSMFRFLTTVNPLLPTPVFLFPNGRYVDCLSLTYATSKGKMLKLHYKY